MRFSNLGTTNSKLTSTTNTVNKINKFYGNSLSFINERSGPATLDLIVELTGNNGVCGIDAGVAKPFFPEAHYYICYVNTFGAVKILTAVSESKVYTASYINQNWSGWMEK